MAYGHRLCPVQTGFSRQDDDALEDLLYGKLAYSASITDRVLNISVWDLTPEAYMTRLGFSQAEKDWATLLYSVMARISG